MSVARGENNIQQFLQKLTTVHSAACFHKTLQITRFKHLRTNTAKDPSKISPTQSCDIFYKLNINRITPHTEVSFLLPSFNMKQFNNDYSMIIQFSWWRGTVVERRSLAGELSLSCARPAADG